MSKVIPVALCFDRNFVKQAAVTTYSIAENSRSDLDFYWIVPPEDFEFIKVERDYLHNTFGFNISTVSASYNAFGDWKTGEHFSSAIYLRFLIPYLIEYEKAIYIDSDVLALGDIGNLYSIPMNSFAIGGVADSPGGVGASKVPRNADDVYINSGVLLMNLNVLRNDDFLKKCEDIYRSYHREIAWPDQCILNKYAENNKIIIDPSWNRLVITHDISDTNFEALITKQDTAIMHFAGPIKPWQEWCNPLIASFWWSHANKVGLENFRPIKISNIDQAISLANVLDMNCRFQQASSIKTGIINSLLKK